MSLTAPPKHKPEVPTRPRRNWVLFGAIGVLIVLLAALGIWWFAIRDSGEDAAAVETELPVEAEAPVEEAEVPAEPEAEAPVEEAGAPAEEAEAPVEEAEAPVEEAEAPAGPVATVEAEIEAANGGDVAGRMAFYDPAIEYLGPENAGGAVFGMNISLERNPGPETVAEIFGFEAAINNQITAVEPCEAVTPDVVRCLLRHENDLFAVAGIAPELMHSFRFGESGLITGVSVSSGGAEGADIFQGFYRAFGIWMADAYPEDYAQMWSPTGGLSFMTTPETAPLFLQHAEEFVAASPDYPVG